MEAIAENRSRILSLADRAPLLIKLIVAELPPYRAQPANTEFQINVAPDIRIWDMGVTRDRDSDRPVGLGRACRRHIQTRQFFKEYRLLLQMNWRLTGLIRSNSVSIENVTESNGQE